MEVRLSRHAVTRGDVVTILWWCREERWSVFPLVVI
jgi:hypothetical protein